MRFRFRPHRTRPNLQQHALRFGPRHAGTKSRKTVGNHYSHNGLTICARRFDRRVSNSSGKTAGGVRMNKPEYE